MTRFLVRSVAAVAYGFDLLCKALQSFSYRLPSITICHDLLTSRKSSMSAIAGERALFTAS